MTAPLRLALSSVLADYERRVTALSRVTSDCACDEGTDGTDAVVCVGCCERLTEARVLRGVTGDLRAVADVAPSVQHRCAFDHDGKGARCCVAVDTRGAQHPGPHLFKCSGPSCPGLPWPASVLLHPYTCTLPQGGTP